ncbi:unnamed protein product [Boreogadus saida]
MFGVLVKARVRVDFRRIWLVIRRGQCHAVSPGLAAGSIVLQWLHLPPEAPPFLLKLHLPAKAPPSLLKLHLPPARER